MEFFPVNYIQEYGIFKDVLRSWLHSIEEYRVENVTVNVGRDIKQLVGTATHEAVNKMTA